MGRKSTFSNPFSGGEREYLFFVCVGISHQSPSPKDGSLRLAANRTHLFGGHFPIHYPPSRVRGGRLSFYGIVYFLSQIDDFYRAVIKLCRRRGKSTVRNNLSRNCPDNITGIPPHRRCIISIGPLRSGDPPACLLSYTARWCGCVSWAVRRIERKFRTFLPKNCKWLGGAVLRSIQQRNNHNELCVCSNIKQLRFGALKQVRVDRNNLNLKEPYIPSKNCCLELG